jgi:hypothetical protein
MPEVPSVSSVDELPVETWRSLDAIVQSILSRVVPQQD